MRKDDFNFLHVKNVNFFNFIFEKFVFLFMKKVFNNLEFTVFKHINSMYLFINKFITIFIHYHRIDESTFKLKKPRDARMYV